ncbi:MAG: HlyD family efflux transporter periplasmic adaptor subunit [Gemmataceae bacterium]
MLGRLKIIPWTFGIICLAFTLFGAKNLFQPAAPQDRGTVLPTPKPNGPAGLGPVVNGTVTTEVDIGEYVAPDVLQLARIKKIVVVPGQTVKVGDPLILFDDTIPKGELTTAQAVLATAKAKVNGIKMQAQTYPQKIILQDKAIRKAELNLNDARNGLKIYERALETKYSKKNMNTGNPYTELEKINDRENDVELLKVNALVETAKLAVETEKANLELLKLTNPQLAIDEAESEVKRFVTLVARAQEVVDACVLRSQVNGIVERITLPVGAVVSPASPKPTIIIVPSGPRLVRAEVVPEFAHKLANVEGHKVIIYDNDNFNLTYEGTVERIGEAFLPRRFGSQDLTALNANRVLECTIRVTDAAPPGKPPLRYGQPVRVSFP